MDRQLSGATLPIIVNGITGVLYSRCKHDNTYLISLMAVRGRVTPLKTKSIWKANYVLFKKWN